MKKTIKEIINSIDLMIENNNPQAPVTLEILHEVFADIKDLRHDRDLKEPFFVSDEDVARMKSIMPEKRFNQWLESKYHIKPLIPNLPEEFAKHFPEATAGNSNTPSSFIEGFSGIY